jgi:hypothetical protein
MDKPDAVYIANSFIKCIIADASWDDNINNERIYITEETEHEDVFNQEVIDLIRKNMPEGFILQEAYVSIVSGIRCFCLVINIPNSTRREYIKKYEDSLPEYAKEHRRKYKESRELDYWGI